MKNYEETLLFLIEWQDFKCPVCSEYFKLHDSTKIDYHHQYHNTDDNRNGRNFGRPLMIDSVLNGYAVNHNCAGFAKENQFHFNDYEAWTLEHYLEMVKAVKKNLSDRTLQDNLDIAFREAEFLLVHKLEKETWHGWDVKQIQKKVYALLDRVRSDI